MTESFALHNQKVVIQLYIVRIQGEDHELTITLWPSLKCRHHGLLRGSIGNEAHENEDRSTKHPKTKQSKSKTEHPNSKTKHSK